MVVATPRRLTRAGRSSAAALVAATLVLGAPLAAAAAVPRDGLVASGQCREGRPQGGYVLRAPDGRVRVQGAFNHGQLTGSFFFWSANGTRLAQLPFDADALSGTLSLWYDEAGNAAPAHKLEAAYAGGRREGTTRWWFPDGRLHGEFDYAAGALVRARGWTPAGAPLPDAEAQALAAQERDATVAYVDDLLTLLRRHLPDCAPPPRGQEARLSPSHPGSAFASTTEEEA